MIIGTAGIPDGGQVTLARVAVTGGVLCVVVASSWIRKCSSGLGGRILNISEIISGGGRAGP